MYHIGKVCLLYIILSVYNLNIYIEHAVRAFRSVGNDGGKNRSVSLGGRTTDVTSLSATTQGYILTITPTQHKGNGKRREACADDFVRLPR